MEFLTSLIPAMVFWASFAFSPGPFWMAWMNYHTQKNSLGIYRQYFSYLFSVFGGLNFILCYLVLTLNNRTAIPLTPLYFIGASFIIYLAVKSFYLQLKKTKINFTFGNMTLITLSNPKVYLTVPAGSLGMIKLDHGAVESSLIFSYLVMPPIMILGSLFFLSLAKLGEKIFINKMRYVTSALLLIYGLFLLYEGIILI